MRIRLKRVAFVSVFSLAGLLFVFYRLQKSVTVAGMYIIEDGVSREYYQAEYILCVTIAYSYIISPNRASAISLAQIEPAY